MSVSCKWLENNVPYSPEFDDSYYSAEDGLAESRYVFLDGNGLPERFADAEHFTIAETGFGAGLNFFAAWQAWQEEAKPGARLHYISFEKYPLAREVISQAVSRWPELLPFADQLLVQYPISVPGTHRITFYSLPQGGREISVPSRLELTLVFGDVAEWLSEMDFVADAWFLDGFAPAKNPDMWAAPVLQQVGMHTAEGGTFATFTAAGEVRRGLKAAGFAVERVKGFSNKRHMSKGIREKGAGVRKEVFRNTEEIRDDGAYHCSNDEARVIVEQCKKERCSASTDRVSREQSANNRVAMFRRTWQSKQKKTTLVVGGGIAGISAARAFAERGWQVTLLEKAPELASCASGNPAGVLFPRVSRDWNPATQFYWTAYALMLRQLERWQKEGLEIPGEQCGMLYSPTLEKKRWQLQENRLDLPSEVLRWVEAEEASKLTGLALSEGGLWFGQGSWVNAQALCRVLVNHPNITVQYGVEAAELSSFLRKQESISRETECCEIGSCLRRNDGNVSGLEYRWRTDDTSGNCYYADCVVIANAAAASRFPQASALKMAENRGQITYLPEKAVSQPLQAIYCRHGYMIPAEGHYVLGATYDHDNLDTTLRDADHLENITQMEEAVAGCLQEVPETFRGRVSLRTTTPQRLPYIGAIAPGLYVSLGHGSRGLLSAPLAAECLAALAENTPLPVSKAVEAVIKPPR